MLPVLFTVTQAHAAAVLANDKSMRTMSVGQLCVVLSRWPPGLSTGPGVAERLNSTNAWIWAVAMGDQNGVITPPAAGVTAPKLDDCRVFFNPVYRYIYIKNTKTAGSSVLDAMGPICPESVMEADDPTVRLPTSPRVLHGGSPKRPAPPRNIKDRKHPQSTRSTVNRHNTQTKHQALSKGQPGRQDT